MDINEIKQALHKADLLLRPYAIIAPPKYKDMLEDNFKDSHEIIISELIEEIAPDQIFIVDRRAVDPYDLNGVKDYIPKDKLSEEGLNKV